MKTITLNDTEARVVYNNGPASLKESLENLYGKKFFSQSIIDRVKSFEDACNELNITPPSFQCGNLAKDEIAYIKLKTIAKALNQGWVPNWKNSKEYKYYPWFDLSKGSGLVYNHYHNWFTYSDVGSRLCFKSSELAEYAGQQFLELYHDFMII
jgi:hypothetical protein